MKTKLYLIAVCTFCMSASFAQNKSSFSKAQLPKARPWLLQGNKGTDTAVNFIGTTDAMPLVFKVNNQKAGFIDYDSLVANTGFGYESLKSNTSSLLLGLGVNNSAFGFRALYSNTGGYRNTANGAFALSSNTTGSYNTANGHYALYSNISGSLNIAIGKSALYSNTDARYNTAIGTTALYSNTLGSDNIAIGSTALYFNTTGNENIAIGTFTLYPNTTGYQNIAIGPSALNYNTRGNYNVGIGRSALSSNTTGDFNTAIGTGSDVNTESANSTAIGYTALVDARNKVRIGNTSVSSIGGQVGWTSFSDARIKQDVKENVPGLAFIKQLRPLTYHFSLTKENELMGRKDSTTWDSKYDIEKIQFTGFIAQEVDAAAKKINYDFSGVDKTGKIWGLRYAEFVVPIIKALQELNDSLEEVTTEQQQEIETLRARLDKIEAALFMKTQDNIYSQASDATISARLEQNVPNPFTGSTTISYYLPTRYNTAYLNFYSSTGFLLKSLQINSIGKGVLTLKAGELPAGSYQYSLVVDGKVTDSKQMIQVK